MKKRKGFTLLEIIVTLSILGICFGLTIGVVAVLTDIQKSSTSSVSLSKEVDTVDKTIQEYVSIISISTANYDSSNDTQVIFKKSEIEYKLAFSYGRIGIYKKTGESMENISEEPVDNVDSVSFGYNSGLALLTSTVTVSSTSYKFAYTIRTQLWTFI